MVFYIPAVHMTQVGHGKVFATNESRAGVEWSDVYDVRRYMVMGLRLAHFSMSVTSWTVSLL